MELTKDVFAVDLGIFLKKHKALIISDLHIGYEEYLHSKGVFLPKFQYKLIISRLKRILEKTKPETIVINGDLKHEFGKVLRQEWKEVRNVLSFLQEHCKKIIIVKGNHDIMLKQILNRNIEIVEHKIFGDVIITHGNKIINKKPKVLIIGHDHPAIILRDKDKAEKFKCFLKGKVKDQLVIVQPSFNPLIEGTNIISEKMLSPYLKNVSDFQVFIVDDKNNEVLDFGNSWRSY